MNHPDVRRYAGGDVPYNRQRYENERFDVILDDDVFHALVRAEGQQVGDVLLAPIDERRGWANLGYRVHPDHWGKGYATEAASLAVTHGFEELALHRVSATIVADNEASKRVVEKLGFVHEGNQAGRCLRQRRVRRPRGVRCPRRRVGGLSAGLRKRAR